jgi:Recombination endonuclease VII
MSCPNEKNRSPTFHCDKDREARRSYGPKFTCDVFWAFMDEQDRRCAICGVPWREGEHLLSVDHCHRTGFIRGLTHSRCQRDITVAVVDAILASEADVLLHRGKIISREVVAYVRNPPGRKFNLYVPREHMDQLELKAAKQRTYEQQRQRERAAGGKKAGPLKLDGPSVRELLREPVAPRAGAERAPRVIKMNCTRSEYERWREQDSREHPDRWRVAMPNYRGGDTYEWLPESPKPTPPREVARRVGVLALVGAGGAIGLVLAVIIIVKLLPGLLLLAATGLLAARR